MKNLDTLIATTEAHVQQAYDLVEQINEELDALQIAIDDSYRTDRPMTEAETDVIRGMMRQQQVLWKLERQVKTAGQGSRGE